MIRGRVIAEGLRVGADLRVDGLELVRLGRHDVSASTLPTDERPGAGYRHGTVEGQPGAGYQHGTVEGQPRTWTFVDFQAPDRVADTLARALADALRPDLGWWADFTVGDADHVIVFAGRHFRYRIGDAAGRAAAVAWGRAVGTPEGQLDWGG